MPPDSSPADYKVSRTPASHRLKRFPLIFVLFALLIFVSECDSALSVPLSSVETKAAQEALASFQFESNNGTSFTSEIEPNNKHDQWAAYLVAMQRYEERVRNSNDLQPNIFNLGSLPKSSLYNTTLISAIVRRGLESPSTRGARKLNTVRIPKSGSSHLSVIGRALVGCQPDGYPCCTRCAGREDDACPRSDLFCPQITGCVSHNPDFSTVAPSISQFRAVTERVVSAFFYRMAHNDLPCYPNWVKAGNSTLEDLWQCFEEYVETIRYGNITTRMMNGKPAYPQVYKRRRRRRKARRLESTSSMDVSNIVKAKKRICSLAWFGIAEMPLASQLLLYEMEPFRRVVPNPVIFDLEAIKVERRKSGDATSLAAFDAAAKEGDKVKAASGSPEIVNGQFAIGDEANLQALRVNEDIHYKQFRSNGPFTDIVSFGKDDFPPMTRGEALVRKHNGADIEIYDFALGLFCARLRKSGLMEKEAHNIHEVVNNQESEQTNVLQSRTVNLRYQHHFDLCRDAEYDGVTVETFCRD